MMHLRDIQAAIIDYAETHGEKPQHGYIHKEDLDSLQLGGTFIGKVDHFEIIPSFALAQINGVLFLEPPKDRLEPQQFALGHTTVSEKDYEERHFEIYPKE
jgi:hypothetical protein